MGVSQYPIHELIRRGETDVLFYRGIANAWALNFLFHDYRLYPNPMGYVYQTYRYSYPYSYPSERVQAVKEWLGRPEGEAAFASVLDDSLTRDMADRFTSYLRNDKGIVKGRGIALLQYLRARYHSAVTSEQGLVRIAELMVMLSLPMSPNKDAVEDTSRYNWFMAMHLLYGYGNGQRTLRDLEHLYRMFPEFSCTVSFRNNRDSLARITTVGREGLSLTAVDLRDIIRSITFANYNYALALYSLLRSLRKYGHPMAAYATKIIAF